MKDFTREDQLFSLCGLNCGLCSMHLDGYCPGCGGGVGNQPCAIARCSLQHEKKEYCSQCQEYPCEKYEGIDEFDSFITHRNRRKDFEKMKAVGIESYHKEQEEKARILKILLENYNDGRRKTFFCLAVNLLETWELQHVLDKLYEETMGRPLKERAGYAVKQLQAVAESRNIILKLKRKPRK